VAENAALPEIAVVVPAFNAAGTIGATLAGLASQTFASTTEVVIVDCGSDDGTTALVEAAINAKRITNLRLLQIEARDPIAARNHGAAATTAPLLAFTDADCAPEPGWLTAGVAALDTADLVQGAVTPEREPVPFDRTVSVSAEHGLYETANLFVTRTAFNRIGGFEPLPGIRLRRGEHFGEDVWFAWRAKRAGASAAFAERSIVKHVVFRRGAPGYVAEQLRRRFFPPLIKAVPELRSEFLYSRAFLSKRTAYFDLALTGLTTAVLSKRLTPLIATIPYVLTLDRRPVVAATAIAADTVGAAALISGSVSARTIVL